SGRSKFAPLALMTAAPVRLMVPPVRPVNNGSLRSSVESVMVVPPSRTIGPPDCSLKNAPSAGPLGTMLVSHLAELFQLLLPPSGTHVAVAPSAARADATAAAALRANRRFLRRMNSLLRNQRDG